MSDPLRPLRTSIGSKFLVGLTGLLLVGFILGHMSGNLLVFAGQDAMNTYAAKLKGFGWLLWLIRAGLLATFVLHIALALRLNYANWKARPVRYVAEGTMQASWASRTMVYSGLALLAFLAFHLAHFTFGTVHRAEHQSLESYKDPSRPDAVVNKHYLLLTEAKQGDGEYRPDPGRDYEWHFLPKKEKEDLRHDVYSMVVSGYRVPWITGTYLVAMLFLGLHLWHGASSMFQSMGANSAAWQKWVVYVGPAVAMAVLAGNCSIPLAVLFGLVK